MPNYFDHLVLLLMFSSYSGDMQCYDVYVSCRTGLTTNCIVYTTGCATWFVKRLNEQCMFLLPVVKPVLQPAVLYVVVRFALECVDSVL